MMSTGAFGGLLFFGVMMMAIGGIAFGFSGDMAYVGLAFFGFVLLAGGIGYMVSYQARAQVRTYLGA
jgi:uncharacterized membrane protein HdeD (DUF308 family)